MPRFLWTKLAGVRFLDAVLILRPVQLLFNIEVRHGFVRAIGVHVMIAEDFRFSPGNRLDFEHFDFYSDLSE